MPMPSSACSNSVLDAIVTDLELSSHAAIDRYYALWQAINPDKPWQENSPTANTIDEPLLPFVQPTGESLWTSRMVQYVDKSPVPKYT